MPLATIPGGVVLPLLVQALFVYFVQDLVDGLDQLGFALGDGQHVALGGVIEVEISHSDGIVVAGKQRAVVSPSRLRHVKAVLGE